ncbi:family 43 glycosylhydrolase [Halalkalibacter sp. APA_J-10(15)]|uniref:family 43 glycosylhydrolase n=1 Tax=unclassified Halalkalibacter TaxID=2893063 RepID=UPI001FF4C123|nr:family 43 glycosylhydrolase [Halalkalibacter sp. APA_J-10(15)]MCK0472276.1 family 43 glycosylhydrolase [Halalkalibacter sp. APA_J-10(15)]
MKKRQAFNPYLPSFEYIPDGEPYVFNDRLYVYGSHDRFNGKLFCLNDYVCWSAPVDDLSAWRYEGTIYRKKQDPMNRLGLYQMFAPDVARGADGRYYLYYTLGFRSVIGVAVCDEPAGEYEFYGYVSHRTDGRKLSEEWGAPYLFDPAIFVDDDGRVYLYYGFAPKKPVPFFLTGWKKKVFNGGYVIELDSDMKTAISEPKLIFSKVGHADGTGFEGHEFFEASSMRKINDTYYFIYSSINGHELCYATSKSPTRDFVYGGTIISNGDLYINGSKKDQDALNYIGNNHGSIVEVEGQWYVFYHRQTNRHHYSRQAAAERIEIEDDGSIEQVEMTSCGLNQGPLRGEGKYEARIACHLMSRNGAGRYGVYFGHVTFKDHPYFTQSGKDRESRPTQYIANMRDGAKAGFKYFQLDHLKGISVKVCGQAVGFIYVSDSMDGEPFAKIEIEPSKEYRQFRTNTKVENGVKALYFTFKGEGALDFYSFELIALEASC